MQVLAGLPDGCYKGKHGPLMPHHLTQQRHPAWWIGELLTHPPRGGRVNVYRQELTKAWLTIDASSTTKTSKPSSRCCLRRAPESGLKTINLPCCCGLSHNNPSTVKTSASGGRTAFNTAAALWVGDARHGVVAAALQLLPQSSSERRLSRSRGTLEGAGFTAGDRRQHVLQRGLLALGELKGCGGCRGGQLA